MNKTDLINEMATKANLSKTDTKKALDAFIDSVQTALTNGDKVSLLGFGTFGITSKSERLGVNPVTLEKITIPARKVVKFKPGNEFAEKVK